MPENRLASDLDHRLGTQCRLLTDSGAQTSGKNDALHGVSQIEANVHQGKLEEGL
jgi:hypothetical protein